VACPLGPLRPPLGRCRPLGPVWRRGGVARPLGPYGPRGVVVRTLGPVWPPWGRDPSPGPCMAAVGRGVFFGPVLPPWGRGPSHGLRMATVGAWPVPFAPYGRRGGVAHPLCTVWLP